MQRNFIFNGTSGKIGESKLQMTSYSDNVYDVTNFLGCFAKFLTYTVFLPSFIFVRHQMAELTLGGFCHLGYAQTPSKIRLICMFIPSYCVKFLCDYDAARDKTDNFSSQTLLELMCFKLFQLSYYVCFCYGIPVHENNYDTSHRQKRFYNT